MAFLNILFSEKLNKMKIRKSSISSLLAVFGLHQLNGQDLIVSLTDELFDLTEETNIRVSSESTENTHKPMRSFKMRRL